jgi:hypothetical protein
MTGQVEVLEIKAVVPSLIVGVGREAFLSALELDWKDRWSRNDNGVNAAPEARHVKLEKERTFELTDATPKDFDRLLPGLDLRAIYLTERVCSSKSAKYCLGRCREKVPDRCSIVGGVSVPFTGAGHGGSLSQVR